MSLTNKLQTFASLASERLKISWQTKKKEELIASLALLRDYFLQNFTTQEKLITIAGLLGILWLGNFVFENLTFRQIDRALENQQSARAENLIKQKMLLMPGNKGLKLRLAHAYLGLEREKEAKSLIETTQTEDPNNAYLPRVAMALSDSLKRQGKAYQAIPILDKLPPLLCKQCKSELLELYSIEGRKSLIERNLERANFFLSKALSLAEDAHESHSSLNHRKRELARAYNLQADQLIKAKEEERAIDVLEKSIKIFPNGQSHLMIAKLYYKRHKDSNDLKKAVEEYEKAYSFGLTDDQNVAEYKAALNKLKKAMKAEGASTEEIDKLNKAFTLIDNDLKARQEQAAKEAALTRKIQQPQPEPEDSGQTSITAATQPQPPNQEIEASEVE